MVQFGVCHQERNRFAIDKYLTANTMEVTEHLRGIVRNEGGFPLSDEILNRFLRCGKEVVLGKEEYIIKPGTFDQSIWITARGVTKAIYDDGNQQHVLGFSGIGTISLSPLCYVLGRNAFCGFQTITECEMIKIVKEDFDRLLTTSTEFARWMFGVMIGQYCALELKTQMLNESDATTRFKAIVKRQMKLDSEGFDPNRPDLLSLISSKDLASYLGITQSYLSNIRKAIFDEERNAGEYGRGKVRERRE